MKKIMGVIIRSCFVFTKNMFYEIKKMISNRLSASCCCISSATTRVPSSSISFYKRISLFYQVPNPNMYIYLNKCQATFHSITRRKKKINIKPTWNLYIYTITRNERH